jgi:hypothetical protein
MRFSVEIEEKHYSEMGPDEREFVGKKDRSVVRTCGGAGVEAGGTITGSEQSTLMAPLIHSHVHT